MIYRKVEKILQRVIYTSPNFSVIDIFHFCGTFVKTKKPAVVLTELGLDLDFTISPINIFLL